MNFKLFAFLLFVGLGVAAFSAPRFALAKTAEPAPIGFCGKLDNQSSVLLERLAKQKVTLTASWDKKLAKLDMGSTENDSKISQLRAMADGEKQKSFANLGGVKLKPSQKLAVDNFKTAVDKAVSTRRQATDTILAQFRGGSDELISSRKTASLTTLTNFQTAVNQAITNAKNSCSAGANQQTTRGIFLQSVQVAEKSYLSKEQQLSELSAATAGLAASEKTALSETLLSFQTSIQKAKQDFKTALK